MPTTITLTEEAKAFFARNPDPALWALVERGVEEYGEFMGGMPVDLDALGDEDSSRMKVYVSVEVPLDQAESGRKRRNDFVEVWCARHAPADWRSVAFSVRYR